MTKLIAYPLTVFYLIVFSLILLIFHPIQWICLNVFGYRAHKKSVDILNLFLVRCLHLLGVRYRFENPHQIASNQAVIIVSNHQSMNDIPPIIWFLRKHHPKFISKKELGKGIPSVSYNLRHGGSVLIDRKQAMQSVQAIENFAERVKKNNWGAVIFPEGSRSRDGHPRPFKTKGLLSLFRQIPNATVIPITVNNSWKTLKYGKFPMGIGAKIEFKVHEPLMVNEHDHNTLVQHIEKQITDHIKHD
ncbi:MAG: 1-acyl-sn-glycerol-3-phosphate acyltransferase [Bacteroidia bacterium]|nr:1-acyl-sn-glycerol-3-phosphate acyltransferase [Bacteroidia bacterium]NND52811.1 1-acyl-sn-glycerol-3-phosphate acyltransferase [Flavobacteriaceae bacterium]